MASYRWPRMLSHLAVSAAASRRPWRVSGRSELSRLATARFAFWGRCRAAARHDAAVRQGRRRSRGSDGGLTGHGCARAAEIVGRIVLRGHPLHAANACVKLLNHMVQYLTTRLDTSFAALSDATRRGVLEQLGRADASITDLAEKFHMTLTGMKKHVGVLEQAGLVTTKKIGRVRKCQLGP